MREMKMAKAIEAQPRAAGKPPEMNINQSTNGALCLRFSGDWRTGLNRLILGV